MNLNAATLPLEEFFLLFPIFLWINSVLLSAFTFTFHFHALEKEMATHSSVFAWRIPGTGEPGGLPSMGSHSRRLLKRLSSSSSWKVNSWIQTVFQCFFHHKTSNCCPVDYKYAQQCPQRWVPQTGLCILHLSFYTPNATPGAPKVFKELALMCNIPVYS